ncbi:o-succinylbenzoate--CoA ligase [Nocardioides marinquilinus]|uniref:O-succinylbenzoate--CoA ligase n=1 Tax=Nocardioides marinquilinus TaxID=1210400 RepID=A0ABP9PHE0_9ACTN
MDYRAWLDAADDDAPPLVVTTSGSSGRPKRVVLSRRAVLASVAATEARLGTRGRWVLRLPETYVAGLMVVLRSLVAGHEPVGRDDPWPDGEGWLTSLVPTQLHRLLDEPDDVAALRRAHTVLLGGGPLDPALRARAEAAGVHVVATYGAAETCGGCVYDGVPLDGVRVAVDDDGRVRLGGPTLFEGYEGNPDLTASTLVDGWFVTADAGRLDADGRLHVLGRLDDVVVSGGVNVPGPAVAARLREHPAVAAAEVLGVPDDEWGHRLVAFVVLRQAREPFLDLEAARDWVGEAHPRAWAPRQLVRLDAVPLLENGKPDRLALRRLACAS